MNEENEKVGQDAELPKWVTAAFRKYMAQADRVRELTQLEVEAISGVAMIPKLLAYLNERGGSFSVDDLRRAEHLASLGKAEQDAGYAAIYANAIVVLWSRLESLIREFVSEWLKHHPEIMGMEPLCRIRVRLGDFIGWDESERLDYLVFAFEQEAGSGVKNGAEKFECLLSPLGLGGWIPKSLKRDMFEFGQIRNVVVHSSGRVDRRLLNSCPWLGLTLGDDLLISKEMFQRYVGCSMSYMSLLIVRVDKKLNGGPIGQAKIDMLKSILGSYYEDDAAL